MHAVGPRNQPGAGGPGSVQQEEGLKDHKTCAPGRTQRYNLCEKTTCLAAHQMTSVGQWVKRNEEMAGRGNNLNDNPPSWMGDRGTNNMMGRGTNNNQYDNGQSCNSDPGAAFLGNTFNMCR